MNNRQLEAMQLPIFSQVEARKLDGVWVWRPKGSTIPAWRSLPGEHPLGLFLLHLRKASGLFTQEHLLGHCGLHSASVSRIKTGKDRISANILIGLQAASGLTLQQLADELGLDLETQPLVNLQRTLYPELFTQPQPSTKEQ